MFATGLIPTGLAFDAAGNLYAGDANAGEGFQNYANWSDHSVQQFVCTRGGWLGFRQSGKPLRERAG
jgi:hypothetical protein